MTSATESAAAEVSLPQLGPSVSAPQLLAAPGVLRPAVHWRSVDPSPVSPGKKGPESWSFPKVDSRYVDSTSTGAAVPPAAPRRVHYADAVFAPAPPQAIQQSATAALTYDDVLQLKMLNGFWYDTVDPHYSTHNDVVYPLNRDQTAVDSWHMSVGLGDLHGACTDWNDTAIPQWTGYLAAANRLAAEPPAEPPAVPSVPLTPHTPLHAKTSFRDTALPTTFHHRPFPPPTGSDDERMLPGVAPFTPQAARAESEQNAELRPTDPMMASTPRQQAVPMSDSPEAARTPGAEDVKLPNWTLNDFDLGEALGQGQLGRIYHARERQSGYPVAIKCISKELVLQKNLLEPLHREIELQRLAGTLNDHILRLYAYFWDENCVFLVLEYAEGGSLHDYVHRHLPQRLREEEVRRYMRELLEAVHALHAHGIVHRDITPYNILLQQGGIKLADFSSAAPLAPQRDQERTPTAPVDAAPRRRFSLCGTWDYWSPERMQGRGCTAKADIWAVGIVCYELLCGCTPFENLTPQEAQRRIADGSVGQMPVLLSRAAASFLQALLQLDEAARPDAMEALQHPFLTGYEVSLPRVSPEEEQYVPPPPPIVVTPESLSEAMAQRHRSGSEALVRSVSAPSDSSRATDATEDVDRPFRSESENTLPELNGTVRPSSAAQGPRLLGLATPTTHLSLDLDDISLSSSSSPEESFSEAPSQHQFPSVLNMSAEDISAVDEMGEKSIVLSTVAKSSRNASPCPDPHQDMQSSLAAVAAGQEQGSKAPASQHRSSSSSHGPTASFPRSSTGESVPSDGQRPSAVPDSCFNMASDLEIRHPVEVGYDGPQYFVYDPPVRDISGSRANRQLIYESDSDDDFRQWASRSPQRHTQALSAEDQSFLLRRDGVHQTSPSSQGDRSGNSTYLTATTTSTGTIMVQQPFTLDVLEYSDDDDDDDMEEEEEDRVEEETCKPTLLTAPTYHHGYIYICFTTTRSPAKVPFNPNRMWSRLLLLWGLHLQERKFLLIVATSFSSVLFAFSSTNGLLKP
eukprot:gene4001-2856_t